MALDLTDKTTNGNNLTNHGATEWTSSFPFVQSTEAVRLVAGSSQYLDAIDSTSLSITGDLTIECWILQDTGNQTGTLVSKRKAGDNNRSYGLVFIDNTSGSQIRFQASSDGITDDGVITSVGDIVTDTTTWHHIAVVYTAASHAVQFYKDGATFEGSRDNTITSIFNSDANLTLGAASEASPITFFNGKMDEVRVWNTARSGAQISANYNIRLTGTETGLKAYYPFESLATAGAGQVINFI